MATPRTRDNPMDRGRKKLDSHVGDPSFPETCPRCGLPCTHRTIVFWESPWNEHGGICTQCITEACNHFDMTEWPHDPRDDVLKPKEKPLAEPPNRLFDR